MVSTYTPQPAAPGAGRPPCASCGAAYRLHGIVYVGGQGDEARPCPEAYRPDTVELARRELAQAEATGDEARVFVARGNLQRLEGRR